MANAKKRIARLEAVAGEKALSIKQQQEEKEQRARQAAIQAEWDLYPEDCRREIEEIILSAERAVGEDFSEEVRAKMNAIIESLPSDVMERIEAATAAAYDAVMNDVAGC